jgi:hypothetical protein
MADKAPFPEVLADSVYSKPMPKWMMAAGIMLGIFMEFRACSSIYSNGLNREAVVNMLLGAICVYGSGISRKIYLSDIGIVREMRSWGRIVRRVVPWNDVKYVSLEFRAGKMMVFFEIGFKGWKVLFLRDQESLIMDILDEMLPYGVEIKTMGKR